MFGPVPKALIYGKATHIIWPMKRWTKLSKHLQSERVFP
uniref:Uncharacterized protein n=1 Tax=Romanomermis culicivorax TaxID=13658 RepID=A0A915HUY5_ROMCU